MPIQIHNKNGILTLEQELSYHQVSQGFRKLGLVGETLKTQASGICGQWEPHHLRPTFEAKMAQYTPFLTKHASAHQHHSSNLPLNFENIEQSHPVAKSC